MSKKLDDLFPKMPDFQGYMTPVYFEPKQFSGERICVGLIVEPDSQQKEGIRLMPKKVAERLFPNIAEVLDLHLSSLSNVDFDVRKPYRFTFMLGEQKPFADQDLSGVIKQAKSWYCWWEWLNVYR